MAGAGDVERDEAGGQGATIRAQIESWGWPVRVRAEQVSLNLDLDLDAVAVVIPAELAVRVVEILAGRRRPPAVLAHPALAAYQVVDPGGHLSRGFGSQ